MRHRALEEPLPSLVIAVAFAVDTALKQDGNWRHRRARSNSSTHQQRGGQGPASRDAGAPEQPKRSTGEVVDLAPPCRASSTRRRLRVASRPTTPAVPTPTPGTTRTRSR